MQIIFQEPQKTFQAHHYISTAVAFILMALFRNPDILDFDTGLGSRFYYWIINSLLLWAQACIGMQNANSVGVLSLFWKNLWNRPEDKTDWKWQTDYTVFFRPIHSK